MADCWFRRAITRFHRRGYVDGGLSFDWLGPAPSTTWAASPVTCERLDDGYRFLLKAEVVDLRRVEIEVFTHCFSVTILTEETAKRSKRDSNQLRRVIPLMADVPVVDPSVTLDGDLVILEFRADRMSSPSFL